MLIVVLRVVREEGVLPICSVTLWSTHFLFSSLFCCLPLAKGEQDTPGRHEQIARLRTGIFMGTETRQIRPELSGGLWFWEGTEINIQDCTRTGIVTEVSGALGRRVRVVISELRSAWRSQPWMFQAEGSASAKTLGISGRPGNRKEACAAGVTVKGAGGAEQSESGFHSSQSTAVFSAGGDMF